LHHAYRYRDYLIRAFNADVPYDQLIREHIAGDLLEPPRLHPRDGFNESIIGTGFWFLGEAIHAPTDVRADEADRIDNQIDVMSKAFLGLTVACARCHDHKFDPIATRDYYALAGYLQSSRRQEALLDPHGEIEKSRDALAVMHETGTQRWKHELHQQPRSSSAIRDALVEIVHAEPIDAALAKPAHPLYSLAQLAKAGDDFATRRDELRQQLRVLAKASDQQLERTELFVNFGDTGLDGWYLTGMAFAGEPTQPLAWQPYQKDASFAGTGTVHSGLYGTKLRGVLRSPTFVLNHKRIHYRINAKSARIRLIVDGYTMDEFNALLFNDVTLKEVDTKGQAGWVTQQRDLYHYLGHRAHIEIIDDGDGFAALHEIRFSNDASPAAPPHPMNAALLEGDVASLADLVERYVLAITHADLEDVDVTNWLVRRGVIRCPEEIMALQEEMQSADHGTPDPIPVIALTDGDGENERVFIRGSHKNLGDEVPRRLLVALAGESQPAPERGSGRLDLARRITDSANPLPARVAVNRLWHHLFGRGIVPSVDDFGRMGQAPSHPELLDWLADDFMRQGWSLKQAIRQMVTSRTYCMSSQPSAAADEIARLDPNNVLLHRAPIRRLTGEAIRDTLLALSGRLDPTMFGPSVRVHLTPFMEGRGRPDSGPLDGDGRRSLYVETRRNFLSPMMLAFDTPSPFNAMGRRSNSNVPAQSLILMNDPFVIDQARGWARLLLDNDRLTDDRARVEQAFVMAFSRPPSPTQWRSIDQFLQSHAEQSEREQLWTDLCHMLINMKSFIYIN
jgi:hypothetical protein